MRKFSVIWTKTYATRQLLNSFVVNQLSNLLFAEVNNVKYYLEHNESA